MKKRLGGIYGGEGGNKCINKSIKIFRAGSALILAPFLTKKNENSMWSTHHSSNVWKMNPNFETSSSTLQY